MGTIHRLSCKNCGAEERYSSGVGMLSFEISEALIKGDLKVLQRVTNDATYKQIKELIKVETGKVGFIQKQSNFCCSNCHTASHLHQVQVIGLSKGDWTELLNCDACGAVMQQTKKDLDKFNCKKCGKAALKDEYAGEWD